MQYIPRHLERKFKHMSDFFKALLVTGARQVGKTTMLKHLRDSNAKEIDIFVEENNFIHPLEIKKSANPDRREVKKFSVLNKTTAQTGAGGIVCMCEEPIPIDSLNCFIPCNLI